MNTHTFTWQHVAEDGRITRVVYTSSADTLTEILADFESYLRGCGYVFDGTVEILSPSFTRSE